MVLKSQEVCSNVAVSVSVCKVCNYLPNCVVNNRKHVELSLIIYSYS